ncbi:hypothetical protein G4B88_017058 [Cannabis sativa]|uniref:Uncharacterized protein n=1 Tax=Cannabis sativa TaxID=3483 RepID=A0A7J6GYV6_CANSA|nr:hypothetical protein G4B88_017058 [Cannabis sativa]
MSQYFFHTCQSDGKERISFTYPPSLLTLLEMIQRKVSLFTTEKPSSNKLYNHWSYKNEEKRKNLSNQFTNRVKALDKTLNTYRGQIKKKIHFQSKMKFPKKMK